MRNAILRIIGFAMWFAVPVVGRYYHPDEWSVGLVVVCGVIALAAEIISIMEIADIRRQQKEDKKRKG